MAEAKKLEGFVPPQTRITRSRVEAYVALLREHNHSLTAAARVAHLTNAAGTPLPRSSAVQLRVNNFRSVPVQLVWLVAQ